MDNMAGDSTDPSSFTSPSSFTTDLPTAAERFLARVLAQTLEENWRNAYEFLVHFPPCDIMQALAGEDTLRAGILIGATSVHGKLARKKPLKSAAEDLELALAERLTDAEQILELFPVDARVRFLDRQKLWSFVSEDAFWQSSTTNNTRSVERMAFLLEAALREGLIAQQEVVEGIGFAEIAKHLPAARVRAVMQRALELGHSGRPLDEVALLEAAPLSELLEVIPLAHVFRAIIVERIAVPCGFASASPRASQSVLPQLPDPKADADVESLFDALQSPTGNEAVKSSSSTPTQQGPAAPATPAANPFSWPPDEDEARGRVCAGLAQMDRLPPAHEALSLSILMSIESMCGELLTVHDDESRERCIQRSFPNEQDLRLAMLALIDLLDPTIQTSRTTIQDCDIDSLIAVVVFEERIRQERKTAAQKKPYPAPASGTRLVAVPPPKPASRKG